VLAPGDDLEGDNQRILALTKLLNDPHSLTHAFELDLRLRPHGGDGPLATTLAALRAYHQPDGGAQFWERQLLTRARLAAGSPKLGAELFAWRDVLPYSGPASAEAREEIKKMRQRIELEKTRDTGAKRAIKVGPGGLVDVEFAAQWLQLAHGWAAPALRTPNTRGVLRAARDDGRLASGDADALLGHYGFLRRIELALRRDTDTGVSELPAEPGAMDALAVWLGRANGAELLQELGGRRAAIRKIYNQVLEASPAHD
jgi:[glutamine synthetase] adenylyltransferase / [glutamine synthetase]-adenylyl-L-tyrosine phosphorylase